MYITFLLFILYSEYRVKSAQVQTPYFPRICAVLFNSRIDCPFPIFIEDDKFCFVETNSAKKNQKPKLQEINKNKNANISACYGWSAMTFTTLKGYQCIQIQHRKTRDASESQIPANKDHETHAEESKDDMPNLHKACKDGKLDVVKYILSQGLMDINCRGKLGKTPVMTAARHGQLAVFDFLVAMGCDLSTVDDVNNNLLHVACQGNNTVIVKKLIDSNRYDIESRGEIGFTPLMAAVYFGRRVVFDLLASKGCNLKQIDDEKRNILHVACMGGNIDMAKYILSLNVFGIDSKDRLGQTPVMMAADRGHREVFDLMIREGCNLTLVDGSGCNILHIACIGGDIDMVKYILSKGIAGIESRGYRGRTPVMIAATLGYRALFDYLLSQGCKKDAVDDDGNNILHMAVHGDQVDMATYILSQGDIDIDSRGQIGRSSVMIAAQRGHKSMFDFLVSKGCKMDSVDDEKNKLLHLACMGGDIGIMKYVLSLDTNNNLESRGFLGRTPVIAAAEKGQRSVVDLLVRKGCNLKAQDLDNNTILHVACIGGHVDMVKYILSHAMVGIESKGRFGRTPVMTAVEFGNRGVFDLLGIKGCDLTAVDEDGNSVLHVACIGGYVDMVQHLITLKVFDLKGKNRFDQTPEQVARWSRDADIVALFRDVK